MEPAPFRRFGEYFQSDCDKWMNGDVDDDEGVT